LLEDSDGRLWVGTMDAGLQRLGSDGASFDTFVHDDDDPSSLGDDYITVLLEDRSGNLWVGTRSGGLNRCDRQSVRCVRYEPGADVSAILEDRGGTLWVGTAGGGISRLDEDGFHRLGSADGLPNDGIRGLAEDDDGSFWISTPKGLTRYDPEQGRAMALGLPDGLPSLDFLHGAATRGKDQVHFGTPKGLVSVPTGTTFPDPGPSPTVFTSIRSLRGPVPTDHPVAGIENLRVPYGEILSFEFAVLDFDASNRHAYEYRLSDVTEEWVGMEGLRELTFTDLKPGTHTLSVKGRNARGVWSEQSIVLEIVPPLWMTWWFRAGLLVAIVLAAFGWYRLRVSALERRNRDLTRLHQELRTLTLRLEAAKEQERRRIARELHDEMGQGLSAAKINLQTFPELPDEAARNQRLRDLVGQVDHMLAHVRALSLDLSPPFLEEVGLTLAIEGYLESVAKRSGIDIAVETEPGLDGVDRDSTIHVFRLVQESITNVMRHSESEQAFVRMRRVQGNLEISIRDEGCGFDLDDVLARSVRGQHLGLLGMRERAGAIGGELTIDSRPGAGTEVRIRVPLALP
jgi:signal transduction histidine kinase